MRPWSLISLALITCSPGVEDSLTVTTDLSSVEGPARAEVAPTLSLDAQAQGPWVQLRLAGAGLPGVGASPGPVTLRLKGAGETIDVHLKAQGESLVGAALIPDGAMDAQVYMGPEATGAPVATGVLRMGHPSTALTPAW